MLFGSDGNDTLIGSDQADELYGGAGDDSLVGGAGDDTLDGGPGNDTLEGGADNDTYLEQPGSSDVFDDIQGIDTIDFSTAAFAIQLDLAVSGAQPLDSAGNEVTLVGTFENVRGTSFNDILLGNDERNLLEGGGGIDSLDGRDGADTLQGSFPQLVYLDFDSATGRREWEYSVEERNAIQARLEQDFGAPFSITFTQTRPSVRRFSTILINAGDPLETELLIAGVAFELDWRNFNAASQANINANGFLGNEAQPLATSENFIGFTSTLIAHELAHLLGLRHSDAFGPIGLNPATGLPYGMFAGVMARSRSKDEWVEGQASGSGDSSATYALKHGPVLLSPTLQAGNPEATPHPLPFGTVWMDKEPVAEFVVNSDGTVQATPFTASQGASQDGSSVLSGNLDPDRAELQLLWSAPPPARSSISISYDYEPFRPGYRGPDDALETPGHISSSPASVGSQLIDAVGDTYFGERELIKLAFSDASTSVQEDDLASIAAPGALGMARDLGQLPPLAVPNLLPSGAINAGQELRVRAMNVVGSIQLAVGGTGPSENDVFAFQGQTGDLLTVEGLSVSLRQRIPDVIDSVVSVYGPDGLLLDYYGQPAVNDDGFDNQDALLIDVLLPVDGTYCVEVDTFHTATVADEDVGGYELFLYTYSVSDPGSRLGGAGDTMIGAAGHDVLIGSAGDDHFLGDSSEDQFVGVSPYDVIGDAPRVIAVAVGSTAWPAGFVNALPGSGANGYLLSTGSDAQLKPLPWSNLDQVSIRFSEPVQVTADALGLYGVNRPTYESVLSAGAFEYDPDTHTATWTLSEPLDVDKLLLKLSENVTDADGNRLDGEWTNAQSTTSGNGRQGGDFEFRLNVLPGDANQNQLVAAEDALLVIGKVISLPGFPVYSVFADINGSGLIAADDALLTIDRIISFLPVAEPTSQTAIAEAATPPVADGPSNHQVLANRAQHAREAARQTRQQITDAIFAKHELQSLVVDPHRFLYVA